MSSMTHEQKKIIYFAKNHDWGYDAHPTTCGGVKLGCDWCNSTNKTSGRDYTIVYTIKKAREWAGY